MSRIKNHHHDELEARRAAEDGMVDALFTPVDFLIEQMGEALFSLSDSLRESGFLNNVAHQARYESVVIAWRGLSDELAKTQVSA